jgi:hypothetical protein
VYGGPAGPSGGDRGSGAPPQRQYIAVPTTSGNSRYVCVATDTKAVVRDGAWVPWLMCSSSSATSAHP